MAKQYKNDSLDSFITLAHGHGGLLSHKLIRETFLPLFSSPELAPLDDAAVLKFPSCNLVFSTDSYVVHPIFFPGGDIGKLAIAGTVNDIAVMGAKPVSLSVAFIIEEGFPVADLLRIAQSMADTCQMAGVRISTADTKVVPKGAADGVFINTSGVGILREGVRLSGSYAKAGQAVILTGFVGEHGAAIVASRNELGVKGEFQSDCRPLADLVGELLDSLPGKITVMRDPTRGGVATTLNEIARSSNVGIQIDESALPVRKNTLALCEILGLDPLYLANEGALVIVLDEDAVDSALAICRNHPAGRHAARIGKVRDDLSGKVVMFTVSGGKRIVDMLAGEMLPRIC